MCLRKKSTNNVEQMIEYLRTFMIEYLVRHPDDGGDVLPIFTMMKKNLMQYPERKMAKEMRKKNLTLEETVLNILQNHALMAIVPQSVDAFMLGDNDAAHTLYDEINDIKLQKKYIGRAQYEANKEIGNRACLIPPGGRWL